MRRTEATTYNTSILCRSSGDISICLHESIKKLRQLSVLDSLKLIKCFFFALKLVKRAYIYAFGEEMLVKVRNGKVTISNIELHDRMCHYEQKQVEAFY